MVKGEWARRLKDKDRADVHFRDTRYLNPLKWFSVESNFLRPEVRVENFVPIGNTKTKQAGRKTVRKACEET